jgi:putative exosortase-associated protein (TIGR04073 family)
MARQLAAICFVLLVCAAPAGAQTALRKLGRGLAGMTTSFLEFPGNIVAETREQGPAVGIPLGFAKGLGMIVARTLVGVYEFVTAPIPAPADYRPLLRPEFPWGYFEGERAAPVREPPARSRKSKR